MKYSALLVYLAVMCITPGPTNLTSLYLGAEYGVRGAGRFITESNSVLLIKCLLCGFLYLALASVLPALVPYLKWVGAAYMLYLAWNMIKSGFSASASDAGEEKHAASYPSGILLQCLNFKSWIVCLSIFSVYVMPYTQKMGVIVFASVVYAVIAFACSYIWCISGKMLDRVYKKYRKLCSVILALSLVYCAVTAVI